MNPKMRVALWVTLITGILACAGGKPPPVELAIDEEVCSLCRMAVSERYYAAEIVTREGSVDYFDDIGCLVRFLSDKTFKDAGIYVVNSAGGEWLDARSAYFVRSDDLPTPMNYGIVAYGDADMASAAAARLNGRQLSWENLLQESFE
ncbi:MAG: nitrous oxide reductase accessory protein NosL [Planctomycetota bacterium]|jgi:copper chaperone NosL